MSINHVNLTGNLTRDPEMRVTQGGMQILEFGIAVNDRAKNQQTGEWEDQPNFFDCTMFGNRAEAVSKYLRKGLKVSIDGKLRWNQWEKDGQKHSKITVIINEIELPQKSENQSQNTYQNQPQYTQAPPVVNGAYAAPQPMQMQQPVYTPNPYDVAVPMAPQQPVAQQAQMYDYDIPF